MGSQQIDSILPEERVAPSSRRAVFGTVLLLLIFVPALNGAFQWLFAAHPELDNATYVGFMAQWHRQMDISVPVETLIIGDSSGRHGVDPAVIDEVVGTRSVNLCTMGNAAVINPAWQLESYLRDHAAPRRVILMIVHDVWSREILFPLVPRVPLEWGYWEHMRAPQEYTPEEVQEIFLARYAPVISQDKTITGLLMYPWHTKRQRLEYNSAGFAPIWRANPENVALDHKWQLIEAQDREWSISAQSRRGLEAMMGMAQDRGFDLYLANSPLNEGMMEDPGFARYWEGFQKQLEAFAQAAPRVHLILSKPAEYPTELMQSSDHIIKDATPDFSQRVGEAIVNVEAGSR